MSAVRFALHGGAGVIDRAAFGAAREAAYRQVLQEIAMRAVAQLNAGESALDVVQGAVEALEDCPFFNAGHGAVLNRDGVAELDAAIMDGRDRRAGSVGAAQRAWHPIALARAVLEQGDHVLLVGAGADQFAQEQGLRCVEPSAFVTDDRLHQLKLARSTGRITLDHDESYQPSTLHDPTDKSGTVGAVARDANGHLAAATSTGGMTNKHPGRVGDSPVIGAGTWADDHTCCISATGHGEFFLRTVLAYDVHAQMAYANANLVQATSAVLERIGAMGGSGGLIAISRDGDIALPFNSTGMYRAWCAADGIVRVAIYADPA